MARKDFVGTYFVAVGKDPEAPDILWRLLEERTPQQSISHAEMPTPEQHLAFVSNHPYRVWYIIRSNDDPVGAAYLTRPAKYPKHGQEIGVFIFASERGKGYGEWAVREMGRRFPGPMLAHVNPENDASLKFFECLGFNVKQVTLECHFPPLSSLPS